MKVAFISTDNREPCKDYRALEPRFGTAPQALLGGFENLPGVEVHVVSCLRRPVAAPAKIGSNIYYHSVIVPKVGWMTTGYQGYIRAVRRKLHAIAPDIVHGQGTERDCAMSAVFSGYPNVLTIHGNMVEVAKTLDARFLSFHWLAARLETLALKRTDGVFCISEHTKALVTVRTRRTWLVPNGLNPAYFVNPPAPRFAPIPEFLHVGTIDSNKQQLGMLQVAEELHRQGVRFRINFAGEQNPSEYCQEFIRRVRSAEEKGFAKYLGLLKTDELIHVLDSVHALVHTPQSEAFGLVIAEALARNLKVFAFRTGGIPDIAQAIEHSVLCEPGDWTGLERQMNEWVADGSIGKPTAQLMRDRYHPESIARRHLEIYREVLNQRA